MSNDADLHSLDVLIKHDEALFGSIRYNSIGLVEQVENINNQINMINNAPAPDVYTRPEANEISDIKADKSDTYTKTETDTMLDEKADKTQLIDSYTKQEDDALLLLKANVIDIVDSYSKTEDDTLLDAKADKTYTYTKTEDDQLLLLKANVIDIVDSYSKTEDDALLLLKADKTETYTKTEDDELILLKANVADIVDSYSKIEDDALLLLKADKNDTYTKTEDDALLDTKADKTDMIDSYSKIEDDALLLLKANVADLTNYVDLTSAQTITGQKQFGIISVSNISKLSKNDASILLAGGGDMLVSSLVTQPQLQEVRDIATGKSKAYVFSTQGELNDWMAVQDNVAKLAIGDNLYIVDKEVTDYWWDGTDLKVLETELSHMSNVITTLGTATGGGNAITDISIDGNVLTPAKNKNFVDTNYDQSISGQKTFNTTIHSVGIMVQTYDNSSVVCAGGGVRSIADIQSASYSKSEDDALLLLKADKSTTYTKTEDDALLLLKADKTQLIDSYTKGETNNLLNNKADTGVSYAKQEDDALLLLKADKTQLIDSYTKGETNNLLNNKADTGVSYTKGEDDALLLLKADKSITYTKTETDQLISDIDVDLTDYYNKTKTDELLGEKVDTTELSNYVTLGTAQTINANKTFNNACRFTSTIDGMSTVTGASFVKSGADITVVLLGAGGTKPISEFTTTMDDTNYVKKTGQVSQSITGNLIRTDSEESFDYLQARQYATKYSIDGAFVKKTGKNLQVIEGYLRKGSEPEEVSEDDEDYVTRKDVQSKYVGIWGEQQIIGTKSFYDNVTANGFIKRGGTNQQVLLANGSTKPLSEFTTTIDDSNHVKKEGQSTQEIEGNLIRSGSEISFENLQPFQYITKLDAKYRFVQKEGQLVYEIEGKIRRKQVDEESQDGDYLTKEEMDNKYVTLGGNQTINGTKTFTISVTAPAFVKYSGTNQQVLLADGTVKSLSEFDGVQVEDITNLIVDLHSNITFNYLKLVRI
ncbi:MAG: hypothetical protein EZS28_022828, partial [Streblomastix strix]